MCVVSVVTLKRGELAGWMAVVVIEDGKGGGLGESAVLVAGLRWQRPCVTAQPHFGSRAGCGEWVGMMSGPG